MTIREKLNKALLSKTTVKEGIVFMLLDTCCVIHCPSLNLSLGSHSSSVLSLSLFLKKFCFIII